MPGHSYIARYCRFDCLPVGYDWCSMSVQHITVHQSKGLCSIQWLSNSMTSNMETYRSRWIQTRVPLLPLAFVRAYCVEALAVYLLVVLLGVLRGGLAIFTDRASGSAVLAGAGATCLLYLLLRLLMQVRNRRGRCYIFAVGNTPLSEDTNLDRAGKAAAACFCGWLRSLPWVVLRGRTQTRLTHALPCRSH